jgi:hypothetical protein
VNKAICFTMALVTVLLAAQADAGIGDREDKLKKRQEIREELERRRAEKPEARLSDDRPPPQVPGITGLRAIDPVMLEARLVTGYPLMRGKYNREEAKLGRLERTKSHLDLAMHMDLAILKQWPEIFDDDRSAYSYANRFLLGATLSKFVAGCTYGSCSVNTPYDGWAGATEFEREASYRAFVGEYQRVLVESAADFPMDLVQVLEVTVKPYDSTRGVFPLEGWNAHNVLFGTVQPVVNISIDGDFSPPSEVPVARDDAPSFLDRLDNPERKAFLGLYVALVEPGWDQSPGNPQLRHSLQGAELYADPDLQRRIHQFGLWKFD